MLPSDLISMYNAIMQTHDKILKQLEIVEKKIDDMNKKELDKQKPGRKKKDEKAAE